MDMSIMFFTELCVIVDDMYMKVKLSKSSLPLKLGCSLLVCKTLSISDISDEWKQETDFHVC